MKAFRVCSRQGCHQPAVATLTYSYSDATAVLGPLSTSAHPQAYELCAEHAHNLTVPKGWQVVRLQTEFVAAEPRDEELEALAQVVRKASRRGDLNELPDPVWTGPLMPEAVTGSALRPGPEYDPHQMQGVTLPPPPPPETGEHSDRPGNFRLLPGGLPD